MAETQTAPAESSPAPSTVIAPAGDARAEWLKTGKVPEPPAKPKTEKSAPSRESSGEGRTAEEAGAPEETSAPASEAGKDKQEHKPRSNADTRLNEILDDLREAGITPKALKTFKKDWVRAQQTEQAEPAKPAGKPEKTDNPARDGELKAPVKPKAEDFEGKPWTEYEAARDKYFEDLADYKAAKRLEEHTAKQREETAAREMQAKLADASKRYGDGADGTIKQTANTIFSDAKIPGVVKALVNDSPVLVDMLYVLGSKESDLSEFVETARTNPSAAIRKLVLVEKLVKDELAKAGDAGESERGEDGKFKAAAPENKKPTAAPPPPREVSGRGSQPADEVARAAKTGDFRSFMAAQNRRDIQSRKGN